MVFRTESSPGPAGGSDGSDRARAVLAKAANHRRALEERGKALTDEALQSLAGSGVDASAAVIDARPTEALLALAEEHQARMIVVGTNGERPLLAVVLGSTPYKLLHHSPVPVLVVPAT